MAVAIFTYIAFFFISVILSDTHQGRVWNQTTQPELVAKVRRHLLVG
jgi:hypothetical protein